MRVLTLVFFVICSNLIISQETRALHDIDNYVVRIYHGDQQVGTGFSYMQDNEEYIVTNYHVVQSHIEKLQKNDTTSHLYYMPALNQKFQEKGAVLILTDGVEKQVEFKKTLIVPDKLINEGTIKNFASSVDLVVLNKKENDTLVYGELKSFSEINFPRPGTEIYCASFPLSSNHLNLSKGISSKLTLEFIAPDLKNSAHISKGGYMTDQFIGFGDYVATSGSSGAPVFIIDGKSKEKILVGINKATSMAYANYIVNFQKMYASKMDSIGSSFNGNQKSHLEILEKFILFSNLSANTIGVNHFIPAGKLHELVYLLKSL